MNLPEKIYTEKDVARAKTHGKLIGWIQGGGIVLGGAIVWNLLGWIPVVAGVAGVGWIGWKVFGGKKDAAVIEGE